MITSLLWHIMLFSQLDVSWPDNSLGVGKHFLVSQSAWGDIRNLAEMYRISIECLLSWHKSSHFPNWINIQIYIQYTAHPLQWKVSHHILPDSLGNCTIQALTALFSSVGLKYYIIFQNTFIPRHIYIFKVMQRNHN